ncbi:MAG: hypothetical protein EB090_03520 [Verrucomicrobia bacterium]|nr:hypothetical protein [Verrucomicrobiota bacterium]
MRIDPRQIPDGGLTLSGSLPVVDYDLPPGETQGWDKIRYDLHLVRTGKEVTITGTLSSDFKITCSRCLDFIPWNLNIKDFCQVLQVEEDSLLDLTPLIREDIILALPLAARCELDGAGRCPYSGRVFTPSDRDDFAEKRRATVWRDLDRLKTEN